MATDLTDLIASIYLEINATIKKSSVDLGIPEAVLKMAKKMSIAFGSAIDQCNQIFWDRRAIAASGNDPLDLAGSLTNPLGATITFANVKAFGVMNRSDQTLTHSGGSHTATDADIVILDTGSTFVGPCKTVAKGFVLEAGGMTMFTRPLAAGWTVTGGSVDIFQVDNQDGADEALYDIVIIGDQD